MDLHLKGKTAIITGGTTGIGKAIALAGLDEGMNIAVFSRSQKKVDAFIADVTSKYPAEQVYASTLDVNDIEALSAFAADVNAKYGSIDVWVNNAGTKIDNFFTEFTDDQFDGMVSTNIRGVWQGAKVAAGYMKKQGSGVIINISSFASRIPHAGQSLYAATKCAVTSFTKSYAAELAPYGIRVVGIVPGMIKTEIAAANIAEFGEKYVNDIAMRRLGEPEDLAKPVVFLCSDCAAYITGTEVEISGGKFCVQNSPYSWAVKNGQA